LIDKFLKKIDEKEKIFFIQIGANDGIIFDHLYKYARKDKWEGILIEPVIETYLDLKKNYSGSKNLNFLNLAISNKNEDKEIYYIPKSKIKENNLNISLKGCSTFHKNRQGDSSIKMRVFENIEHLKTQNVKCITSEKLIKENKIEKIDLLQIDAEGHEHIIITSFPFNKVKPSVVIFETNRRKKVFSDKQLTEMFDTLKENGYSIIELDQDTIAYLKSK